MKTLNKSELITLSAGLNKFVEEKLGNKDHELRVSFEIVKQEILRRIRLAELKERNTSFEFEK